MLKSAFKGALFGGVMYLAGDQASDMITYSKMHSQAMALVEQDEQIPQMIGNPYTSGAWYDATLAFSHRDKVAHCTFQLKGSKGVTDVAVKAGRQPGYKNNILYNLVGPSSWQLLSCQVMVPSEGGLVAPRSLMPEHQQQEQQYRAAEGCQPCQAQQPQQNVLNDQDIAGGSSKPQQHPQSLRAQQGSWWSRLWRRRQQQQQLSTDTTAEQPATR